MSEYSYAALAKECHITIPSLQRAYAQGRATSRAAEIRNNFIADIKEALDRGAKLSLDTVYGELSDKGVFTPLDGQQRLTTLFLLHLYLARYAEIAIAEVPFLTCRQKADGPVKSKFCYATRTTSGDFCDYLIQKDFRVSAVSDDSIIPPSFDENDQEKEGITQRIIKSDMDFQWTWYNDPTIAAMLNMLDTIHKIFCGDNTPGEDHKAKCREYYQKLVPDNANDPGLVTFWYQEITGAIPADELYVRMNARGLALTEFENYKAALFYFLGSGDPTHRTTGNINTIKQNIDSVWQEAVWNYCKAQGGSIGIGTARAVDTILLRIFHVCILFVLIKRYLRGAADDAEKRIAAQKTIAKFIQTTKFDQYELSQCTYYRDLEPAEKEELSMEIIRMMELTVEAIRDDQIHGYELEALLNVSRNKFSYDFILYFYVRYYLVPKAGGQTEVYDVLRRLIKYSYISEFKNFEPALNALCELMPNADGFLQKFRDVADPEEFVHNGFAKNQTWEEHLKLKMKEKDEWRQSIETAEKDPFFDGQILFLFECLLDRDIADLEAAEKTNRLMEFVNKKDDPDLRKKFDKCFRFCKCVFAAQDRNLLRKLLMLLSISGNAGKDSLPDYPFTPEYAEKWKKENASSLRNPGSMILDVDAGDKLSWKRVLRIDLSNQKNDKPAYRKLIRTAVQAACDEEAGDAIADMQSLLEKWMGNAVPPADGAAEPSDRTFQDVRKTLLEWCRQPDWDGYNHSGIRLHDHDQIYLLGSDGARLNVNYQELHMMLMKARLTGYRDQLNCNDRGRLTLPLERTQEEIRLEYYDGKVRGCRCRRDRNSDLPWQECSYEPEAVIELIDQLKNACGAQTPAAGEGENAQA